MTYPRRNFDGFTLEVPPGLFEDDEAPRDCAAALTAAAPAALRIWKIEPVNYGDLATALAGFCRAAPREIDALGENFIWPGLAANEDSAGLRKTHYVFESRGVLYYGVAAAPDDLWADYGPFLEGAMLSLDIGERPSPTLPLRASGRPPAIKRRPAQADLMDEMRKALTAASGAAIACVLQQRFDDAEKLIQNIDGDIYGANALAEIYALAVEATPADDEIFDRALHWARRGFPDPHTADEAARYAEAVGEREARLKALRAAAQAR